jgi:hypothetical protein
MLEINRRQITIEFSKIWPLEIKGKVKILRQESYM